MKEYNWRAEREKYQPQFNKRPQNIPQPPPPQVPPKKPSSLNAALILWVIGGIVLLVALGFGCFWLFSGEASHGGFEKQIEKNENAVGVVCVLFEFNGKTVKLQPIGTAWAFEPQKFATNAHVAHGIHSTATGCLLQYGANLLMRKLNLNSIDDLKKVIAQQELLRERQAAEKLVVDYLMKETKSSSIEDLKARAGGEDKWKAILEKGIQALLVEKYEVKDYNEFLVKFSNLAFNAVMGNVIQKLKAQASFKPVILINKKPQEMFHVESVQIHPLYKGALSPDVAVLHTVESNPHCFKLASKDKINTLKQGRIIAMLGFPMENLINGNLNIDSPVATFQDGTIVAISDFELKDVRPEQAFWIRHSIPMSGGASGSPIFDEDGEVIALANSGMDVNGSILANLGTRVSSGAQINGAIRVDLLQGALQSEEVPATQWVVSDLK